MNAAALRKAFEEGVTRMEKALVGKPPDRMVESDGRDRGLHRGDLRHLRACDPLNRSEA